MKFAVINGETILLHADTYERIPAWRLLAAQGKIRCPGCGDALTLIAGISADPYFLHTTVTHCPLQGAEQPSETAEAVHTVSSLPSEEAAAAVELGSFRLPQRRPISQTMAESAMPRPGYRERLNPKRMIPAWTGRNDDCLHPEQQRAVHTTEGPLLILAGAGSGKTRVMTARCAHLIGEQGVDPRTIMVVTFTTKAAEELKQRLSAQLSRQQAQALVSGTFHSIFYRILTHHQPQRWAPHRLLKQNWQKRRLLLETGALHQAQQPDMKEAELEEVLAIISRWKNEYLLPADLSSLPFASDEEERARLLYPHYEEAKRHHGWFDFDDMLCGCYELLLREEEVRRRYQERIRYVMIDEFQDINRVQYETIKLLAAPQNNLCVVGDDDQSIYGFRGSSPAYILGFTKDYPDAKTITLEVNFRSRSTIVGLGYSLIGNNRARWKKELKSFHTDEGESFLFYPADEEEQASRMVDEILHQRASGASLSQFAVLFRTSESARPILERMMEADIPFRFIHEDEPFYEKQAVRWALGYLRLALNPDDAGAMREIMPTLYLAHEQWNALRSQSILDDKPLLAVLPRLPGLKGYQRQHLQKVGEILAAVPSCSPAQALELIYEDGRLRDYVKKRSREGAGQTRTRTSDDLQQLLAAAKRHATIPGFLAHVAAMTDKEKARRTSAPALGESVQVMSIHRAKGLEFDTVFLPDLVEGALPHEFALEELRSGSAKALEEERRLMYVAITRARRQLFIGIPRERFGRTTRISRFIGEMGR
ncbi:ATP-dependent helicase [Brevibacillus sp. SYP-B805]|uniref:UvrD-helicase domain-containing protein n=1 Tax=Brevibacillus sp. SYP-B805 TaxID=1578199 RepID=UPI0013EBF8B3|nr:ATP-dependent helicase [Brevibacillus sp. SYP-B805]NGQ95413.1 ATP-dependent helicase [Brevibacillus sp. SYP-B805]